MNTYQEKCEAQYLELQEVKAKPEKAIKALEEISKETCEVGMYKESTNEARIAIEALKEIKGELDE